MDIEERAERWVKANYTTEYIRHQDEGFEQGLIEAYLAGASQARQDEEMHRRHLEQHPGCGVDRVP